MTTTPNPTAEQIIEEVLHSFPERVWLSHRIVARLRAAGLLGGDPTEEHEKSIIAEIVTDSEIGERAAAIMRETLSDRLDPSPEDRAATPSVPGLYLDRLGNVWRLHQDGVFAMSSRIRGSAAYYAPFERLVVAGAAGVAPQEPQAGKRLDPEFRAELIEFARLSIQAVWDDVPGGVDAATLAQNVVGAQEFAWISRGFPVAPQEPSPVASTPTVSDDSGHGGDDDRGDREDGPEDEGRSHKATIAGTPQRPSGCAECHRSEGHKMDCSHRRAPSTDHEKLRVEVSNEIAGIVFDQVKRVWPDLHPVLDLRYGIADAVIAEFPALLQEIPDAR